MKKAFYTLLLCLFALYLLILLYILFLSRPPMLQYSISEYFLMKLNIVPLKTIIHYVSIFNYGYFSLAIKNVLGNFVLFLPMGIFLPCLFKKMDKFYKVVIVIAATVLVVEILQGLLRVGTPDIDDLILNISGAMLGYATTKIPLVNKLIKKLL